MGTILKEYHKKRDFFKTSEPKGKKIQKLKKSNLIFVVQHHIARRDHFDLRLEWENSLLSWAIPKGPSSNLKDKRLAIQVENHPVEYGDFEGNIPKGQYGGGTVMLWDKGFWKALCNVENGLKNGNLKFALFGKRLKGKWALIKMKIQKEKNSWILIKEKDEYAKSENDIKNFNTSIKTSRTMSEIEKNEKVKIIKNPFNKVSVQLLKFSKTVPEGDDWIYELKYDGYRIIAFSENNSVRLMTRNNLDYTRYFKDIASSVLALSDGKAVVLDGEVVITDDNGKTNFQLLQNHINSSQSNEPGYVIFDILALNGIDLRKTPLINRKKILKSFMKNSPKNLYYSKEIKGKGEDIFRAACKLNAEGIVAKKINSTYSRVRNGSWIKLKCRNDQEFIIGGYTLSEKSKGVSSLLLGFYKNDKFIFAGRAGTGLTQKMRLDLEKKLKEISQEKCSFNHIIKPNNKKEKIFYAKPKLIAQIQFADWTKDNLLKQASFKGLREDKDFKQIKIESNIKNKEKNLVKLTSENKKDLIKKNKDKSKDVLGVKITNPDKIIFENPETKKIDIINYYLKASKRMLPFLVNRPVSVKRCPGGIASSCFYERNFNTPGRGVSEFLVDTDKRKKTSYFYIENVEGLLFEAQLNTVEFHIWGSKIENIEFPDIMVFDLDPDEGMELKKVRQGVKDLKSILDKLSLVSFLKTSGGKGYHVVVPFKPKTNWLRFSEFAKNISKLMEENWPDKYTSNIRKASRKNKIFIDWVRNTKAATSVAPYSVRAKKGAAVSMPISWKELKKVAPNSIGIKSAIKRLKKTDPWKDFFKINQELK